MVYCILVAVSKEDSILYYTEDGTDWSTYNNNSFVPVFTDNIGNWVWPSEEVKTEAHNIIENTDNSKTTSTMVVTTFFNIILWQLFVIIKVVCKLNTYLKDS